MRTERISLTLDQELLAEARAIVGPRKLSSYINRALRLQVQHDRIPGLIEKLEQEPGPMDAQATEEVRQAWLLPDEPTVKRRNS